MSNDAPVMVLDESPLDYTHGLPLPDYLTVNGRLVEVAHPGKIHDEGTTILCYWFSGLSPPFDVAWRRSVPLGEPWFLPGTNMIGVRLSRPTLGAKVINALTGGKWDGVLPIIQREHVSAGVLHASAAAAKAGLVKAGTGIGGTTAGAFYLLSIAPYLIVGVAAAALAVVAYKVTK